MSTGDIVSGQKRAWGLLEKLGEGDAGEVYRVESIFDKKGAILKRPHRNAFSSDIIRQAAQIEAEGKILRALEEAAQALERQAERVAWRVTVPGVLDQSEAGNQFSEGFFIVIEKAEGVNLDMLARTAQRKPGDLPVQFTQAERLFVEQVAQRGEIPWLILLRALAGTLDFFERIHSSRAMVDGAQRFGVIWNDVKPEHLFWQPSQARLTLIDWGNGQFLDADGVSRDRQHSREDDYRQFLQEMGRYLAENAPDLYTNLGWSAAAASLTAREAVRQLRSNLESLLRGELDGLREIRQREASLVQARTFQAEQLQQLVRIHARIGDYGELPDYTGGQNYCTGLARGLITAHDPITEAELEAFIRVCEQAVRLPGASLERWEILKQIAALCLTGAESNRQIYSWAILAGLEEDWPAVLWYLFANEADGDEPAGPDDLQERVRHLQPEIAADSLTPFVILNRSLHTLQVNFLKLGDAELLKDNAPSQDGTHNPAERLAAYENLIKILKEEVIRNWSQYEPDPPDSGLEYSDIDRMMEAIGDLLPEARQALVKSLDQPKAQAAIVLEAWRRKEFETARRGLRRVFFWDPERRRVFLAERAILAAPTWLEAVQRGPRKGEALLEFATRVELDGRELRNRVGPARWLDLLLDTFRQLRRGARPADVMMEHPELLNEMPWLMEYTPRKPSPSRPSGPVVLERLPGASNLDQRLRGTREGQLGEGQELFLCESLDTWVPEARGSSARVFAGYLRGENGQYQERAVKLMRDDRLDYALPLFREEVRVLSLMQDVPGVTRMVECGFIQLEPSMYLPADQVRAEGRDLHGNVVRFGIEELQRFLLSIETQARQGWIPYLALEKRENDDNLMLLCDAGYTHGRFLPVKECLRMAIQICQVLQAAHARNIVYRDHKILHYYWLEAENGIYIIDWNVSKLQAQGLSDAEKQFDLVQFGARALHHILTGRPAQGALPAGPTSPEEIEAASRSYSVDWTFDDLRLSKGLREILEGVLAGNYNNVTALQEDLLQSFVHLPDAGY
jgi:serine/threonine protein kinase